MQNWNEKSSPSEVQIEHWQRGRFNDWSPIVCLLKVHQSQPKGKTWCWHLEVHQFTDTGLRNYRFDFLRAQRVHRFFGCALLLNENWNRPHHIQRIAQCHYDQEKATLDCLKLRPYFPPDGSQANLRGHRCSSRKNLRTVLQENGTPLVTQ